MSKKKVFKKKYVREDIWSLVRAAYERGLEDAAESIEWQLCDEHFELDDLKLLENFSKEKEKWLDCLNE